MSLLRNVLRKNSATTSSDGPPPGLSPKSRESLLMAKMRKSADAISLRSAGGVSIHSVRSIAESVSSFTSQLFGGQRVPKRRRPEISRLGAPTWYNKDPPPAPEMPGTEKIDLSGEPYTAAHAYSFRTFDASEDVPPYCAVVLYSYAEPGATFPRYYDDTKVRGEVRLHLARPDTITSIDVWMIAKTSSVFNVNSDPHLNRHANLWSRDASRGLKERLPSQQTLVFPFEMPVFPKDIKEQKQDSTNVTRLPLPPTFRFTEVGAFSGDIKYLIGVNIKRSGLMSTDDEWNVPFLYYPLRRPAPREPTTFPFISDREDWPFKREEIGGWTITPFGGRGRFRDEMVEIEGLLGVQAPEVAAPGDTLRWSVLLWSKNIPALEALSVPDALDVVLCRSTTFGRDVLQPKNAARKNRALQRVAQGRAWRTDDGPPEDDAVPPLRGPPRTSGWGLRGAPPVEANENEGKATPKSPVSPAKRTRFQEVIVAEEEAASDEATLAGDTEGGERGKKSRSPSPVPSLEGDELPDFPDMAPLEGTVRLDGDVKIPAGLGPSFRYMWMGREYVLMITLTHPEYMHLSPSAAGIYAETPIWLVLGNPSTLGTLSVTPEELESQSYLTRLPVTGDAIDLGSNPVYADLATGVPTTQQRPTREPARVATF